MHHYLVSGDDPFYEADVLLESNTYIHFSVDSHEQLKHHLLIYL